MKILKNKMFIYVLCLMLAGAFAFVALPSLYTHETDLADVVRLTADVEYGTLITANMVTTKTIGAYGLDSAAITDVAAVVGKYAAQPISASDNITAAKLAEESPVQAKADQRYVTVSLSSAAAGDAGYIKSGALVDVLAYDDSGEAPVTTRIDGVLVYSIKNSDLQDTDNLQPGKDDTVPAYATLITTPAQASQLVQLEYGQKVHLVLHPENGGRQ